MSWGGWHKGCFKHFYGESCKNVDELCPYIGDRILKVDIMPLYLKYFSVAKFLYTFICEIFGKMTKSPKKQDKRTREPAWRGKHC